MDIQEILNKVDLLFEQDRGEEAEKLMRQSIEQAVREEDDGSLLQLLNELLSYYRETSQRENAYSIAAQAIAQARRMGLEGTVPYATTLLNVANAYRACGRLEESLDYYGQVKAVYDRALAPDSMLVASLHNNISLLYQELGDFGRAKESLLQALKIVEPKGEPYEIAVTHANLAGTCVRLGENKEAASHAGKALEIFRERGVTDSHYGAALAAMGACADSEGRYEEALRCYKEAMEAVERSLGHNEYYLRLEEYVAACEAKIQDAGKEPDEAGRGLRLARDYYETCGRPMIEKKFPQYAGKIAVGLAGRGSDCFGWDDAFSRDHDWGPDFCLWVSDETYAEIGAALQEAYEGLPANFGGFVRAPRVNGKNRRGVIRISEFYKGLVGTDDHERIDWRNVSDAALAAAVNGQIFRDDEGIFSDFRSRLQRGYPEEILYLKLAESAARFAQAAQYNFPRMRGRGDGVTAQLMLWDGLREAMKLQHYVRGMYPPHDKWLRRSLLETEGGESVDALLAAIEKSRESETVRLVEELGSLLAMELYRSGFISDTDSYLDAHSEELAYKASLAAKSDGELVDEIARLEFEAFDKVHNEGGRASCQNDWATFSIMRKSQYLTWNRQMLFQYLYDFRREYQRGHNLIEEKYGRMMESTAPEKYEEIKNRFPELSEDKKRIIEQICGLQVSWMEEFAREYPAMADNARSIHTAEDNPFNTSYETYLRGELGTYSDKMLELYGRYIVDYARSERNLARDIMGNSVRMYGYADIDEAEEKTRRAYGQ